MRRTPTPRGARPSRDERTPRAERAPTFAISIALAFLVPATVAHADAAATLAAQATQYASATAKSVLELQQFRATSTLEFAPDAGSRATATLINLNPHVNEWHLLRIDRPKANPGFYHLTNRDPARQSLTLDPKFPHGIVLVAGEQHERCELWSGAGKDALIAAARTRAPNVALCGGRLFLRNPTVGHKSSKEWATDFLRSYVPGGEAITSLVKDTFYRDSERTTSALFDGDATGASKPAGAPGVPLDALIDPAHRDQTLVPAELGIAFGDGASNRMRAGGWYPATGSPGMFVSAIVPKVIAAEVIEAQRGRVKALDEVESASLAYLIAFDLDAFEAGFMLGTDHPRVGWSDLYSQALRDPGVPGPDGIDTVEPLVRTGIIAGHDPARVAATFVGGFKRYHGAFRRGELSTVNRGSHYGFIESGVVMSKLQPGLATAVIYVDGSVELKTWTRASDADLPRIRHARQNGVPLIDHDPATGESGPGALVVQSQLGNWSASKDKAYRTVRSGLCWQESDAGRFLVFGYFSSGTPSALARTFQAYRCRYAMMLDINALEHTYLAVYRSDDGRFAVQNLIKGMGVLDKVVDKEVVPRFVGYADNRDFFYLLRKRR